MSNTPPPRVQTGILLKDLAEDASTQGVYRADLLVSAGAQAHARSSKFDASRSRAEGDRLLALGSRNKLAATIVAAELLRRITPKATGMHGAKNGIPPSSLDLEDGSDEPSGELDKAGFDAKYKNVSRPTPSADDVTKIKAEAPYPELALLLTLKRVATAVQQTVSAANPWDPVPFQWLSMLTDVVADAVTVPIHVLKHRLQVERPEFSTAGQTTVPTPPYAAFPGGHAALAAAMAVVLASLLDAPDLAKPNQPLGLLADGIADRRRLAGLHVKFDNESGDKLGRHIGKWLVGRVGAADGNGNLKFPSWTAVYELAKEELFP